VTRTQLWGLTSALVGLSQLGCREVAEVLTANGGDSSFSTSGAPTEAGARPGGSAGQAGAPAGGAPSGGGASSDGGTAPAGTGGNQAAVPELGLAVDCGDAHSCATRFGILYCWGANVDGRLGVGDTKDRNLPTRVGFDADWISVATGVAHTCALKQDGSVWCFGANTMGQLGQGTIAPSSVPLRVPLPGKAARLSSEANTACVVLTDGKLYCWGRNWEGNIGLDDTHPGVDQLSPIRSGDQSDWVSSGTGDGHTCGIRGAGLLFGWGRNTAGNLGLGQTNDQQRRAATPIGSDEDWLSVVSGQDSSCGIRLGGDLFCWGGNSFGNLGLGDTVQRLVPTQVEAGREWTEISIDTFHGCGIDADQRLYCWGRGIEGQLGTAANDERLTPSLVDIVGKAGKVLPGSRGKIAAGRMSSCVATADDRVLCTGENAAGQLGLADNTRRNTFTELTFP
jgi:alpha-tubulin suppressor-like RCC1 family protein